jgi:hypothetical protein
MGSVGGPCVEGGLAKLAHLPPLWAALDIGCISYGIIFVTICGLVL